MYFRYNATSGCVGDNAVEPGDIENMDGCKRCDFLSSCPMCWDNVTSGLGGRHIYFRYNATSGYIDNTIVQLDLENTGIAVEIVSVGVMKLEITPQYFTRPLPL